MTGVAQFVHGLQMRIQVFLSAFLNDILYNVFKTNVMANRKARTSCILSHCSNNVCSKRGPKFVRQKQLIFVTRKEAFIWIPHYGKGIRIFVKVFVSWWLLKTRWTIENIWQKSAHKSSGHFGIGTVKHGVFLQIYTIDCERGRYIG